MVWSRTEIGQESRGPGCLCRIVCLLAAIICGVVVTLGLTGQDGKLSDSPGILILAIGASYAGTMIAGAISRIARPDSIFVEEKNMMDLMCSILGVKFFWTYGIRLLGAVVGAAAMGALFQ